MNDPKRWLEDDGGATPEERALLEAGRTAAMPGELRKQVWVGVSAGAAGLAVASEVAGSAGLGAASHGAGALGAAGGKGALAVLASSAAAKGIVAVAIVVGAGFGVAKVRSGAAPGVIVDNNNAPAAKPLHPSGPPGDERARDGAESAESLAAPLATDAVAVAAQPGKKSSSAGVKRPAVRSAPTATLPDDTAADPEAPGEARAASRLREESQAVLAIRKALLDGDAPLALRMLDRARSDFPKGAMTEEREALTVRALVKSGQGDLARQRGEAFLRSFPRSPHASEVRVLAGL
jgi:hypothetical protein